MKKNRKKITANWFCVSGIVALLTTFFFLEQVVLNVPFYLLVILGVGILFIVVAGGLFDSIKPRQSILPFDSVEDGNSILVIKKIKKAGDIDKDLNLCQYLIKYQNQIYLAYSHREFKENQVYWKISGKIAELNEVKEKL